MALQFTKVTKTYSTKNKLQLYILKELELVDGFLFLNKAESVEHIRQLYNVALETYNGNAAVPPLKNFEANENDTVFYVEDVIYISIYTVKTDLS
jgi:hypothetical protein